MKQLRVLNFISMKNFDTDITIVVVSEIINLRQAGSVAGVLMLRLFFLFLTEIELDQSYPTKMKNVQLSCLDLASSIYNERGVNCISE